MECNPVIIGTDLAAAHTALRKADALRQEQADNFAWLALPLSDMCCARKEKKEMARQAAERWAESRRVCCMCVRKVRQRETRAGEGAGRTRRPRRSRDFNRREGGRSERASYEERRKGSDVRSCSMWAAWCGVAMVPREGLVWLVSGLGPHQCVHVGQRTFHWTSSCFCALPITSLVWCTRAARGGGGGMYSN